MLQSLFLREIKRCLKVRKKEGDKKNILYHERNVFMIWERLKKKVSLAKKSTGVGLPWQPPLSLNWDWGFKRKLSLFL